MSSVLAPMSVLVGTTIASYCLWQLTFDPFRGPLPGRVPALAVLVAGVVAGVGMVVWGFDRLGPPGRHGRSDKG